MTNWVHYKVVYFGFEYENFGWLFMDEEMACLRIVYIVNCAIVKVEAKALHMHHN